MIKYEDEDIELNKSVGEMTIIMLLNCTSVGELILEVVGISICLIMLQQCQYLM